MIRRILTSDFGQGLAIGALVVAATLTGHALSNPPADPVVIALSSEGVNQ